MASKRAARSSGLWEGGGQGWKGIFFFLLFAIFPNATLPNAIFPKIVVDFLPFWSILDDTSAATS
jgi:hypothetical protein